MDKVLTAANVGVGQAEQLYNIGQLEPGERKDAARQYVTQAVALMGVEVTPEVTKLIDGAIEAEVLNLRHKPDSPVSIGFETSFSNDTMVPTE